MREEKRLKETEKLDLLPPAGIERGREGLTVLCDAETRVPLRPGDPPVRVLVAISQEAPATFPGSDHRPHLVAEGFHLLPGDDAVPVLVQLAELPAGHLLLGVTEDGPVGFPAGGPGGGEVVVLAGDQLYHVVAECRPVCLGADVGPPPLVVLLVPGAMFASPPAPRHPDQLTERPGVSDGGPGDWTALGVNTPAVTRTCTSPGVRQSGGPGGCQH